MHAHRGTLHRLLLAFAIVATFFVVEIVAGLLTNSLALLSDAGHMFTDVLGLGMAAAAVQAARRGAAHPQRTFGLYRLEILAALANAALLTGVAVWVIVEAVLRLEDPPPVDALPMLVVAVLGLAVNLVTYRVLGGHGHAHDDGEQPGGLNLASARLEVLADALGSASAIVSAIVILTTGFLAIDALLGLLLGLWILPRTFRIGREALRVLLQAAPRRLSVTAIENALAGIGGVVEVHDLHVWTLTSGMEVCTAHLEVEEEQDAHRVLRAAEELVHRNFGIEHTTFQVEPHHAGRQRCPW